MINEMNQYSRFMKHTISVISMTTLLLFDFDVLVEVEDFKLRLKVVSWEVIWVRWFVFL